MPKIDVITAKLTVHIPVDLDDPPTVQAAAERAKVLLKVAKGFGQASMPKPCFGRVPVPAPEPEASKPAAADLDIPESLRRKPKAEQVAAE